MKGISSRVLLQEYPISRRSSGGKHLWAREYLTVSSGSITDDMIKKYIDEQEAESVVDDRLFPAG